jgi:hypothetical protein
MKARYLHGRVEEMLQQRSTHLTDVKHCVRSTSSCYIAIWGCSALCCFCQYHTAAPPVARTTPATTGMSARYTRRDSVCPSMTKAKMAVHKGVVAPIACMVETSYVPNFLAEVEWANEVICHQH